MRFLLTLQVIGYVAAIGSFFIVASPALAQQASVRIISVQCVKATQGSDEDEIYFLSQSGQRSPKKPYTIRKGEKWITDLYFPLRRQEKIRLFEADTVGSDDQIGVFTVSPSMGNTRKTLLFRGDSSLYKVTMHINEHKRAQYQPQRPQYQPQPSPNWSQPGPGGWQQPGPGWSQPVQRPAGACSVYKGHRLTGPSNTLQGNSSVSYVGQFWDDQILSYQIAPRCRLKAFIHPEFRGPNIIFQGSNDVPPSWVGQISSLQCNCQ